MFKPPLVEGTHFVTAGKLEAGRMKKLQVKILAASLVQYFLLQKNQNFTCKDICGLSE
jgi:hypothetical protein